MRLVAIVLNARNPNSTARFWAHALRWHVESGDDGDDGDDGVVTLKPTDTTSFDVLVRLTQNDKVGQNRIHFDLTTATIDDRDASVIELLAIGATYVDVGQSADEDHIVLGDPEGNEFCIIEPGNRFLASCPRLGALNCDGTRALGHFWSAALDWPLVWDQDEETAIQSPHGHGPKITWSGPPLMPRLGEERFHFHVAPDPGQSVQLALDRLAALGSTRLEGRRGCTGGTVVADVDGNRFCLVEHPDREPVADA